MEDVDDDFIVPDKAIEEKASEIADGMISMIKDKLKDINLSNKTTDINKTICQTITKNKEQD